MSDLFATVNANVKTAIDTITAAIDAGNLTRDDLNKAMERAYGGSNSSGAWTQRESFELLEAAIANHQRRSTWMGLNSLKVGAATILEASVPTQTVRSEDQLQLQQFSTPAGLAALVAWLGQPQDDDIVLEPSAGNGMLVAALPKCITLQLNEIDPKRRLHLEQIFPEATISGHDAALIGTHHAHLPQPSLILMNPPFSRSAGRGADQNAAARHLHAAIRRLAPEGRIVAIMPDWFQPSAAMQQVYDTVLKATTVHTVIRLENAFAKHGTSIATRIYVIDKTPGEIRPAIISGTTTKDILDHIEPTPRKVPMQINPSPLPTHRKPSPLISALKAPKSNRISLMKATTANHALVNVTYDAHETPLPIAEQVGIYLPYRPSRVSIHNAAKHPTDLVESVAMGSIPMPMPTYTPTLYKRLLDEGILSNAQIETLIYAGDAWQRYLPGKFTPQKEGVGLSLDENGRSYRMGYFLGDGTGAGKGRQGAALILDAMLKGSKRHIWISKNEQLHMDAVRDWQALGGLAADVQPISQWRIDETITLTEGILFITYPTLRSQRQDCSRLKQVLDWATDAFDGVIYMDEAHEMGGVAGGEGARGKKNGSLQGTAGVLLQNHLPEARVAYASATGASTVENLAYAVRLGLWGPGTAFPDRDAFITEIRKGGIAAMELVARDLKATGLYAARALSFAGVEYEILKHELTPDQIETFNTYCDCWEIIHQNLEEALKVTAIVDTFDNSTLNSGAKSAARSRFESTKQRFFGQVLLAMKLPTLIRDIEESLANQQSAVIQIVTTAESILDRRLDQLDADERANLDLDLSPMEYIIDYLDRSFPTVQMETYQDDTDRVLSRPMYDDAGRPVHNPEAEAAKAQLIEHVCALPPIRPALDALIEHFGTNAIAEVTGRTKRLVPDQNGGQKLETRSARTGMADAAAFMDGNKRILIFSDAGGTGKSYHASLTAKNQDRRKHYLLEPGWRADRAIQGLGRTHRTHQASTPVFTPVTTNVKGELRFTSTIARRLDSLGALTRGQRQTGGQNLFDPADNLESDYAKSALVDWYCLLSKGKLESINLADFERKTALQIVDKDGVLVDELPPIQRFLNRVLAMKIHLQDAIFDEFLNLIEGRVEAARKAGKLDIGVETVPVENATVSDDIILRTDTHSGATTHLLTINYERRANPRSLERILQEEAYSLDAKFVCNEKSGRVALRTSSRSILTPEGDTIRRYCLMRPSRNEYLTHDEYAESSWQPVSKATFQDLWETEFSEASEKMEYHTVYVATGLLLPVWAALPSDYLSVRRIVDQTSGRSWLGRIIHQEDVAQVLAKFGVESTVKITPANVLDNLHRGKSVTIQQPFEATLKRSLVNRESRYEISGAPASYLPWLKSLGCFTEIIQYKTRVFVPEKDLQTIVNKLFE